MLELADRWVWDAWYAVDGDQHRVFHLQAPRSLGDPELRHRAASVGHATSADLRTWSPEGTALAPSPEGGFDDLATWTGCAVRADDGWHLITTGLSRAEDGLVQRIGGRVADGAAGPWGEPDWLLEADPRWYAVRGPGVRETHWRDPWVERGADGRWHLHATARAVGSEGAVVAHAVSEDLRTWSVQPPLSPPSRRFTWAEVVSFVRLEGRWWLLFSCLAEQMPDAEPGSGGTWIVACEGPGRPVDLDAAVRLTTEALYVAKVLPARPEDAASDALADHRLVAFLNHDRDGRFAGVLTDPLRLAPAADGAPALAGGPEAWRPPERPALAGDRSDPLRDSIHEGSSGTYLPVEE